MSFFRFPEWISNRFRGRATTNEMNDALNLEDDVSLNDAVDNERLLFQYIMRRWISELDLRHLGVEEHVVNGTGDDPQQTGESGDQQRESSVTNDHDQTGPEIPTLNMADVDLALREHINNNNQRSTVWIQLLDVLGVTLFPIMFLKTLKSVFSFISFSDDVLEDTDIFLNFVRDNSFESLSGNNNNNNNKVNSLISKFGKIVYEELIYYFPSPKPLLARILTLFCFYIYTTFTSLFMMVSFVFLLLCLTYTFGKRWSYIDQFLVNVSRSSNGVF